jgi:hypothetical protein
VIYTLVKRKHLNDALRIIHEIRPKAFVSIEDVRTTLEGVFPAAPCPPDGTLPVVWQNKNWFVYDSRILKMEMIFFVLNDPDLIDEVLDGWQNIGVTGATIFETTGFHRRMKKRIPMRYLFGEQTFQETGNITLMALVPGNELVQQCLAVTEQIVGDLNLPNTGVLLPGQFLLSRDFQKTKRNNK